jgi:hypothetical protein
MADNLQNTTRLVKGKAIGAQKGLADTFNEILDILNRLEVDTPLKLDKLPFGKWILGLEARQETVLTISKTDDDNYTISAKRLVVLGSSDADPVISFSLAKTRLVSGVEWDSPDLKEKAVTGLVIRPESASGMDTATGTDTTIATFVPHSSL